MRKILENNGDFRSFFQKSKNLTAVGLGNLIANAISAVFWLFLASILGKDAYGELGYFLAIIGTASAFALLGSNNTLVVYVAKGVKIQATIFAVTFIAGFIVSIIVLVLTQNIFISFYPLAFVAFSVIIYDYLGKKAFANYAKYMIIQRILMVMFSLVFLQFWEINGIIFGYTLSLGVFSFLVYQGFKEGKIEFGLLRTRSTFIISSYVTHVLAVSSVNIDKMLIFPLFGAAILGPYQLGFQIFVVLLILPKIVSQYTLPHDALGSKNIKLKKITILAAIIITICTIFLSPIFIPEIFPKYTEAIEVIQIMALGIVPASLSLIFTSELLGNENSKSVAIGSLFSIIALSSGILLLGDLLGLIGMAMALVIAKSLECIVLYILKKKIL